MKMLLLATALLSIALTSCKSPEVSCTPNFTQGGFGAQVTYVEGSLNEFLFEVCYNDDFLGSQVSVFGVSSQVDLATLDFNSDVRLPHMTDGLFPGDRFSVPFNNDDSWFVIYEDDDVGNYSNAVQVLRGQFR